MLFAVMQHLHQNLPCAKNFFKLKHKYEKRQNFNAENQNMEKIASPSIIRSLSIGSNSSGSSGKSAKSAKIIRKGLSLKKFSSGMQKPNMEKSASGMFLLPPTQKKVTGSSTFMKLNKNSLGLVKQAVSVGDRSSQKLLHSQEHDSVVSNDGHTVESKMNHSYLELSESDEGMVDFIDSFAINKIGGDVKRSHSIKSGKSS